jgi:hypothetical protein
MDWNIFVAVFGIFMMTAYVANRLHCTDTKRNRNEMM